VGTSNLEQLVSCQATDTAVLVCITWSAKKWGQESGAANKHQVCLKAGRSANEILAILTLAYDEYAMKKSSVL
jgi:hypothetical protein